MPTYFRSGSLGISKFRGRYVTILGADLLARIAEGVGVTEQWLARDAAAATLELYDTADELLDDAVKGKINVEIFPAGDSAYYLEAVVRPEPPVFRSAKDMTVAIDEDNRPSRSKFVSMREAPSITRYVATQMKIAFDKAAELIESSAAYMVQSHVEAAFKQMGVKMSSAGRFRAPVGGVEFGGSYYKGGQFVPGPK